MQEFLLEYYDWLKAIHIISFISWMAAMLYLPRLFVYHTELLSKNGGDFDKKPLIDTFKVWRGVCHFLL